MLTAEQLESRGAGIGGSDAPTIAMVNPYKQPFELYMEKIGDWQPEDISEREPVLWGNLLEEQIGKEWARRNDAQVRRDNRTLVHADHPWMLGHIDFRVTGVSEGLEIKNRSAHMARHYGKSGTDEVYESDLVQCQHYMAVTGWKRWHVACYFGGGDFRTYEVQADPGLISDLIELEREFWRCVEQRTPPAIAFEHGTIGSLLDRLYPGTDGTVITLPDAAEHWHKVLVDAASHRKRYADVETQARAHMRDLIGEASVALLPDGSGHGYTRKVVKRAPYEVAAAEYVDMRFTKKPKGVTTQ